MIDLGELLKIPQPIDRVRAAIDSLGLRTTTNRAQCPAHDDERESLSIGQGDDGRALVKCFAGCSTNDICAALGMPVAALFVRGKRSPGVDREARKREVIAAERATRLRQNADLLDLLERQEGITRDAIEALGVGQTDRGLSFAERDARGRLTAFSILIPKTLRSAVPGPPKLVETGGTRGMIHGALDADLIVIAEGAATTAAVASCGFAVIGMPTASYCPSQSAGHLIRGRTVAILPDADGPGRRAAEHWQAWALASGAEGAAVIDLYPEHDDGRDLADELRESGRTSTTNLLATAFGHTTFEQPNRTRGRPPSSIVEARTYLTTVLGDGDWHPVIDVERHAPPTVSRMTLKRARKQLSIETRKHGRTWNMRLPHLHQRN